MTECVGGLISHSKSGDVLFGRSNGMSSTMSFCNEVGIVRRASLVHGDVGAAVTVLLVYFHL